MTKFLLLVLLVLSLLFSIRGCLRAEQKCREAQANQRSLLEGVDYYRTRDSLSAASVERLTLTKREVVRYCADLVEDLDRMKIKLRRVQSASTTSSQTDYSFKTVLKDTVIVSDTLLDPYVDTLRVACYSDPWLTFSAVERGDTMSARIESRDTLITIVHRVPRQFLFIKWGCKAIRQEVISKNPHSQISYTRYIELKK